MGRKKRPFIDRSKARTYELVWRPRGDTREGPERVLRLVESGSARRRRERLGLSPPDPREDPLAYQPEDAGEPGAETWPAGDVEEFQRWEREYRAEDYELGEFGFDSGGYDYAKHFKEMGGGGGVYIPSRMGEKESVDGESDSLQSRNRERDEAARLAALAEIDRDRKTCKDLDEVLAALDSDEELEGANAGYGDESGPGKEDSKPGLNESSGGDEEDLVLEDDFVAVAQHEEDQNKTDLDKGADKEERKSRLLDAQFDQLMKSGYASGSDSGDSETEQDDPSSAFLVDGLTSHRKQEKIAGKSTTTPSDEYPVVKDLDAEIDGIVDKFLRGSQGLTLVDVLDDPDSIAGARAAIRRAENEVETSDSDLVVDDEEDERERWDCETIISTYSNIANHPKLIDDQPVKQDQRIRLDPRVNAPVEYLPNNKSEERRGGGSAQLAARKRGEDKETRRARKKEVKAKARERRKEKSQLKKAFGKEFAKQEKHAAAVGKVKVAVRF